MKTDGRVEVYVLQGLMNGCASGVPATCGAGAGAGATHGGRASVAGAKANTGPLNPSMHWSYLTSSQVVVRLSRVR